jgi:hypothetical protein
MATSFPFLTAADPAATSEGTLDPLGLYQISDQLASELVPAVRERMIRIRFLTAIAVGAFVTEGLADDPAKRDSAPYLAWEWHLVEAIVRCRDEAGSPDGVWGVPGTVVARRAVGQHGYLDARSYLSTPRVFGFHGVYKRLAHHLGVTNVHLGPGPSAERIVDCWAKDRGLSGFRAIEPLIAKWRIALERALDAEPRRTHPRWNNEDWLELAQAFSPDGAGALERKCLRELLLAAGERNLGALPHLWSLQQDLEDDDFGEETLHDLLEARDRSYVPILRAIRAYEAFSRSMQDAFDVLRHRAATTDARGFSLSSIEPDPDFRRSVDRLHARFGAARAALGEVSDKTPTAQPLFTDRFSAFEAPMDVVQTAHALRELHEHVQQEKSVDGKRPWFDGLGGDRIFVRLNYRIDEPTIKPSKYLHAYRGAPIRRFFKDLRKR